MSESQNTSGSIPPGLDPSALSQLACPACYGALLPAPAHLLCAACSRRYPVIDGIPVLIPARAEID